eukprot:PITA_22282
MAISMSHRLSHIPLFLLCSLQAFVMSFPVSYPQPSNNLIPHFYDDSCPMAEQIVQSIVEKAVMKEARMAASLLRLHFHDCFVQGCDASLLLDNSSTIVNILAISARDSVVLSGGMGWEVLLGRRDSRSASLSGSNNNIPAPNSTLQTLITKFKRQGLDEVDLVALSGSHTIGQSRCTSFRQRLYNQSGNGQADSSLDKSYYSRLISGCPKSGGDNNLSPLDFVSPTKFDNYYFKNLRSGYGLLNSDEELFAKGQGTTMETVKAYAENEELFLQQFAESMVKMGNINPLTGTMGEIRVNCRTVLN